MGNENELFGELHEQEENGLFGNEHRRQYEAQQEALKISSKPMLADSLPPFSKDKEIGLYEKFLDSFTDKDGIMKPCNPDAIFNFFANNVWR